jgi:hypothetical protein
VVVGPVPSDAVASTLATADAVFVGVEPVVDSYRLALPNKFFEALMSGRPVVYPRLPEMVAVGAEFGNARDFDASSSEDLSRVLAAAVVDTGVAGGAVPDWSSEEAVLLDAYAAVVAVAGAPDHGADVVARSR